MKNLKSIIKLTLLLFIGTTTYGQKHVLDSIYLQINSNLELNMAIYDYNNLAITIEKDLKNMQSILKVMKDIPEKTAYLIIYEPDNLLSINSTNPVGKIIWGKDKHSIIEFKNQCHIKSSSYNLKIQFNEIEKLISDSLIHCIKEVIDSTNSRKHKNSRFFNYTYEGENLIFNKQLDKNIGHTDILTLKGGVGLNLIKNQPVLDISAELGIVLNKKGLWKNQYYLSYNHLTNFGENSKINANGFLNIGYRYNSSNSPRVENWVGLELGYLVSKHGNLFKENTFKFGFNWDLGKYISVSPQLYLSGDFTEFFPALRIGIGL